MKDKHTKETKMQTGKDAIYSTPLVNLDDFNFDEMVAQVFPDMIQRSVPGYSTIVDGIGQLAARFAQDNSSIYDLGAALGAASLAVRRYVTAEHCNIIAVDNSKAMVERCKMNVQSIRSAIPVTVVEGKLQDVEIRNASVIIMNFTLQFIPTEERQDIIQQLFNALTPGGVLIISEKVDHAHNLTNELLIDMHHEFKRRNGYSELEISQKRSALENVMRIDTFDIHQQRFANAGFEHAEMWYKCFNFCSMFAIKGNV